MTAQFTSSGHEHYAEAMRFAGMEALARLSVADRIVDAEREAMVAAVHRDQPRTRPVLISVGALLVRLGERLEAAAAPRCQKEYA
jgi:hypothetical protein